MHPRRACVAKEEPGLDSLRGSSVNIGTTQRRLAWPLRKDDTHKPRSVNKNTRFSCFLCLSPLPHARASSVMLQDTFS